MNFSVQESTNTDVSESVAVRRSEIYSHRIKRLFDLVFSISAILILIPFGFILSLIMIVSEGRPVLFSQDRFGRQGRIFRLHKLRTMRVNENDSPVTVGGEDRITSIGQILRKTKLDELPQLIHVLNGDMSIVGPRPDVPQYVDLIPPHFVEVLSLRPGITGLATIAFRYEEEILRQVENPVEYNDNVIFPLKQYINMAYLKRMNLFFDIQIVLATVFPALAKPFGIVVFLSAAEIDDCYRRCFDKEQKSV